MTWTSTMTELTSPATLPFTGIDLTLWLPQLSYGYSCKACHRPG